jgi:hypothetical protein
MPQTSKLETYLRIDPRIVQRRKFEAAKWKQGKDFYPINPEAEPNCTLCNGHGICDDGYTGPLMVDCPQCWK